MTRTENRALQFAGKVFLELSVDVLSKAIAGWRVGGGAW